MNPTAFPQPSTAELVRVFGRIGLLSFGGPAGQIALMHRTLVEERKWLDEPRFLHALNYCMVLPGPEAMQLATYAGWLLRGVPGGLIAGLLFVAPGAVLIVALTAAYLAWGHVDLVQGLLFGLKAAVLAVVLDAMVKLSRRALGDGVMVAVAVLAFVAIAFLKLPFPAIIVVAASIGLGLHLARGGEGAAGTGAVEEQVAMPEWTRPTRARFARTLAVWSALWFGPLILLQLLLGPANVFSREASFFSIMAAVTFGGAYAVLAWVAQQAVEVQGWLRPDEMLTGLGFAETTPGPLILVLVYVGFLGAARLSGLDPVLGGLAGAAVTLWFTFVPCFLWIFVGAPYVETVRGVRWLATALSAVTASVVGIIANLTLWFALHVLFASVGEMAVGPLVLPVPAVGTFDPWAALIAVAAAVALIRFKIGMLTVLAAAMAAGIALRLAGTA